MDNSGQPVTIGAVAANAGVSRSWLYAQADLRVQIERLRQMQRQTPAYPPIPASSAPRPRRYTAGSKPPPPGSAASKPTTSNYETPSRTPSENNAPPASSDRARQPRHARNPEPDTSPPRRPGPSQDRLGDTVRTANPQVRAMIIYRAQDNRWEVRSQRRVAHARGNHRQPAPCCRVPGLRLPHQSPHRSLRPRQPDPAPPRILIPRVRMASLFEAACGPPRAHAA
jgi:hypothetical protein